MKTDIQQARAAITTFRDAARQGVEIGFRQRDPLVALLHDALDEFEQTDKQVATLTAALRRKDEQIEKFRQYIAHFAREHEADGLCAAQERAVRQLQEYLAGDKEVIAMVDAALRAASEGAP